MKIFKVFALLIFSLNLFPQSNFSGGRIKGIVQDMEKNPLYNAKIEAKDLERGTSYETKTNKKGYFLLDFLPVGNYKIIAIAEGYNFAEIDFELKLGSENTFLFTLQRFGEVIEAKAEKNPVETSSSDSKSVIGKEEITSLPFSGRDFSDLVILAPQVFIDSNERIHIVGARGISNSFQVDGADNNSSFFGEERGGVRPPFTFSASAIESFQVTRDTFSAQFGQATGGLINAITKSGTNETRGEAFWFFRDKNFVQKDANGMEAEDFKEHQFGGSLGGPVFMDKMHYFLSYDGQLLSKPTYREFNDPTGALEKEENRAYLSQFIDLDKELGTINQTNDQVVLLGKIDNQLNLNNRFSLRYNFSDNKGENTTDNYRTTGWSNNGIEKNRFHTVVGNLTSLLSYSLSNELIIQWAKEERPREPNSTNIPEVIIGNYDASFGQKNYLPNNTIEERWQIIDNLNYFYKNHNLRLGIDFSSVNYDNSFFRYGSGSYRYASWDDFFAGKPRDYTQAFSSTKGFVSFKINYYNFYLQDEWKVFPNLTLKFGLRYEYQENPKPMEINDKEPQTGYVPKDKDNWAPRFSFAFDPKGNGKSVLRGGIGKFYGTTPALLLANAFLGNGIRVIRVRLKPSDPGFPEFPNIIPSPEGLPSLIPDIYVFSKNYEQPEVLRTYLGYEREILKGLSFNLEASYGKFSNLERKRDKNLNIIGTNPDGTHKYSTKNRPNPNFGRIIEFVTDAEGKYKSLSFSLKYKTSNLTFETSYTWSNSKDNDSNERSVSTSGDFPEDQYFLQNDWGPSNYDIRHKWISYFIWQLPKGFSLSGIGIIRSGIPFTAYSDLDENGDGYYTDRANYNGNHFPRNSFRQPYFKTFDLKFSKKFPFSKSTAEFSLLIYNLFNSSNRTTDNFTYYITDTKTGEKTLRDDFGVPNLAGSPRQAQISIRFSF